MDDSLLPLTDKEHKENLRRFVSLAFKELMQFKPSKTPECVPTRVWFDLDLAAEAWRRRGHGMDA